MLAVIGAFAAIAIAIGVVLKLGGEWDQFWNDVGKTLDDIGQQVSDVMSGKWGKAWADATQTAKDFMNVFIDIGNAVIHIINQISQALASLGGGSITAGSMNLSDIPRFATGGIGSGLAIVGENGPELVNLPGGSSVSSTSDLSSMSMGAPGAGAQGPLQLVAGPGADSAVATMIMQLVRSGKIQLRQA
jgi:hypothetical protein